MPGALDGIRVIDMTSVGMGPYAAQMLGDLGADVIKVESPEGDVMRHVTPRKNPGMSHAYLNFNRNKRSIVVDARIESGRATIFALVESADVFVSNIRPQAMRRLGLDYDALAALKPNLIYCACYGYGEGGPYAGRPGVDDTIQAIAGVAALQGVGRDAPAYVNTIIADKVCALQTAQAILAALVARERTGVGQSIEVPMFESIAAFVMPEHLAGLTFDPPIGGSGYSRLLNAFRKPFRTRDGFIGVVPYTDAQWHKFFTLAGRPDMATDPRYRTLAERTAHIAALYAFVESAIATATTAQWEARLSDADIPFAPVKSIDELIDDPHLRAVGFWHEIDHPSEGRLRMPRHPVNYSRTPASVRRHAPQLGEHTEEILEEINRANILKRGTNNGGTKR